MPTNDMPYLDAAMRIGEIDPWIRRVNLPDGTVHVQCDQCNWTLTAITGYQAAINAAAHECWKERQTTFDDVSG